MTEVRQSCGTAAAAQQPSALLLSCAGQCCPGICMGCSDAARTQLLSSSAAAGRLQLLQLCLTAGARVNQPNTVSAGQSKSGQSWTTSGPLSFAKVLTCRVAVAAICACMQVGWVPLHQAAQFGHLECVKELLDRGAAVNQADKVSAAQMLLCSCFLWAPLYVPHVLAGWNHTTARSCPEWPPRVLEGAAGQGRCSEPGRRCERSRNAAVFMLAVLASFQVSPRVQEGLVPLHMAAENDRLECLRELLGRGAAVDHADLVRSACLCPAALRIGKCVILGCQGRSTALGF
jgi:hypothetical protein